MTSSTTARLPSNPLDLELTILSAKHLKNVNWRNGDIKPYVVFWLDSDRRLSTKPDQSGSTKPVWNETFTLPINLPVNDAVLSLEILHSKPSETPNSLIGSVRIHLKDVFDGIGNGTLVRKFELRRPSGRLQGKIFIKLAASERDLSDYAPPMPYYYSTATPPPPPGRDYRQYPPSPYASQFPPPSPAPAPYYGGYSEPYPGYYSGYYQQPHPARPVRPPYLDHQSSYGGPSAPVDYAGYDQKQRGNVKLGIGSGVVVGAVAEGFSGLAIHEGVKYDKEKVTAGRVESDLGHLAPRDGHSHFQPVKYVEDKHGADRVESDLASGDGYSHYRSEY